MSKAPRFPQITAKHQNFPFFYCISDDKNFIPKYPDNALTDSVLTSRTSRRLLEEKAPENDFQVRNNATSMASVRCFDNSDVIATQITTYFHLYLIQLWWQCFQMFIYGDVVYAQTW